MIGVANGTRSFGELAHYLAKGRSGSETERVAWSASRNLPTNEPELAGKIMRATASQNGLVNQPGYHLALSFHPEDTVDRVTMERVADRTIAALGLSGHQTLIVCHRDRPHPHVHMLINRVHPETGRAWNRWYERLVIQKALLEEEIALGLRITPGRLRTLERNLLNLPQKERSNVLPAQNREPEAPSRSEIRRTRGKFTLTEGLRAYLGVHSRVVELNREEYNIQLETDAARVRVRHLEEAAERAQRAESVFKTALADIRRDPVDAHVNRFPGPDPIESELAAGRAEVERAQSRHRAIWRQLRSLPDRAELERRIVGLLDRLSPKEVRQLRLAIPAPQLALTLKLKSVIRDTALARDEIERA
jgi:Relaxase/Mobilisation nuclease domain